MSARPNRHVKWRCDDQEGVAGVTAGDRSAAWARVLATALPAEATQAGAAAGAGVPEPTVRRRLQEADFAEWVARTSARLTGLTGVGGRLPQFREPAMPPSNWGPHAGSEI